MSVAAPPYANEFHPACCTQGRPNSRATDASASDTDRQWAAAMHLSPFASLLFSPLIFAPLVLWMIRKDDSPFGDDHGREIINFGLSFFILHVILAITLFGMILWPVLWVVAVVNLIRGGVAAGRGEYFRYPMTFRFLS